MLSFAGTNTDSTSPPSSFSQKVCPNGQVPDKNCECPVPECQLACENNAKPILPECRCPEPEPEKPECRVCPFARFGRCISALLRCYSRRIGVFIC